MYIIILCLYNKHTLINYGNTLHACTCTCMTERQGGSWYFYEDIIIIIIRMSVRITIDQSNQINSRDVLSSGYKELLINKKL